MATNVGKSKTKEKENLGPALLTIQIGDKELNIGSFAIMANGDVYKDPFNIGDLHTHECVYDERKKIAKRILEDGTEVEADIEKFEKIANKRKDKEDKGRE